MTDVQSPVRGEVLVAISNRIVAVYKELYGKGPVKVRTWLLDDVIVCVLRGGLTRCEQTLVEIGRGDRVALQRATFHEVASPIFSEAVEEVTGRNVVTMLDASEEAKDVSALVFLLEPADSVWEQLTAGAALEGGATRPAGALEDV
jgi:uncharacterized protein YbcI